MARRVPFSPETSVIRPPPSALVSANLVSVHPIVQDGYHNAFCGFTCWRGYYYVSYRTGDSHNPYPGGEIVILRMHADDVRNAPVIVGGSYWKEVARISTPGDDRDPHLVADDDWIWCSFATYYPRWGHESKAVTSNMTRDYITHISSSPNGTAWSRPYQVFRPGYWLWSVVPVSFTDKAGGDDVVWYGAAYHTGDAWDTMHSLHLLRSEERIWWTHRAVMYWSQDILTAKPSEPCLYIPRQGELACVARLENGMLYGAATYPYGKWDWTVYTTTIHAPSVVQVNGKVFIVARSRRDELPDYVPPKMPKSTFRTSKSFRVPHDSSDGMVKPSALTPMDLYCTALWELCFVDEHDTTPTLRHLLTLPSWGDTSYAGTHWDAEHQELLVAYYSMHDRKPLPTTLTMMSPSDVFLARIALDNV